MSDNKDRGRSQKGQRRGGPPPDRRRKPPPHQSDRQPGERPLRPRSADRPDKPELPSGVKPNLPRHVRTELRNIARGRLYDDVAVALTIAGEAIDEQQPSVALPYLRWAKSVVSRSASVREALGVALYLDEDYRQSLNELRTYRRLSGSLDQEHLVADCLRALGRPTSEVAATVQEMLDGDVPADRKVEALIVWAGAVADSGDLPAARAVLRRADRSLLEEAGEEARERYRYVVGDLADRAGDRAAALAALEPLADLDGDPYDLAARVEGLRA